MELLCLYVIILLLTMFDFSSGIIYNNKGDIEGQFSCSSQQPHQKEEIIQLYLSSDDLKIHCFFHSKTKRSSQEFLSVFTSGGLAPSLEIINSTYTGIFHFNLTLYSDQANWLIIIPRENITKNTEVAAIEEWLVRINLQHGLNIYTTEGTLLDTVREPILQWKLGAQLTKANLIKLYPHVVGLKVTKCPCANDVALLGFILNSAGNGHMELSVVDMVLTNHFFVILTSLGLFISHDLRSAYSPLLKFSRADFCGFERRDYVKGKLWYNERCFANTELHEVDYVTVTFERNRTLSEESSCFYSPAPFFDWLPCLPPLSKQTKSMASTVITFLVDQEHSTGVYLLHNNQKTTVVSVHHLKQNKPKLKPKFPPFMFPSSFSSPVGIVFHPRSHFLYAYGNQVWLSIDGGNTFELLADFHDDVIKSTYHSFYTSDIIFLSQSGKAHFTKAGLETYSDIGSIADNIFTLYYDHMGFIHKLTPDKFVAGGPHAALGNSQLIFGQAPDMGFRTALAPQYITTNEMIFYAYVPPSEPQETIYTKTFNNIHSGKVIQSRNTGKAYIREILQSHKSAEFLSAVIAEVIEPFGIQDVTQSPCLSSTLSIAPEQDSFKLTLQQPTPGVVSLFQASDIEKTVVIPGYSSFLIISIVDDQNALAKATMPRLVPTDMTFVKDSWFLYDFGQKNGQTWEIHAKPCNYWFQQHDDSLSLSVLKYIDLGKSYTLQVKVMPHGKGTQIIGLPLVKIIVGNPTVLQVKVEGSFDDADNYLMKISVASQYMLQGTTSLAFIIGEASTDCFVTTFVPILKSSCSYLKSMHHNPSKVIPLEDWLSGVHKDSQGFNMIKTLPINYRPPSNMGIAIPLTDNFYHADPSKPIPRNLFLKSKKSGKFKQCANVSTREECNCTLDQKFSHAVAFSDCREKVPRFKFPVTHYPVSLAIHSEDGRAPVKTPYLVTVTEVNERENWELKHTVPENVKKLKNHLESILKVPVYNPSGLNLSIRGSELFHFRVSVVPGVTFCELVEEFEIYVDEVPLPFPGHTLIAIATAVVLGGMIFIVFMLQIRNIHPWDKCKTFLKRSKMN
ncbi:cation channel sperm associated auxiliary subunit beta [Phyllostomus discolor]|uniref:Cation channel sperm associated auxiliary subunit beta n=1 Tax=Phyllostomus discolor TaxID=89673 RepID=A0A834BH52_9CHIR|nr:cation channel sperm associated auxiliary subunit beta [Phyllostomus discolor]